MRKLNIASLSMSLLSIAMIFSVGFSSWLVVKDPSHNASTQGGFSAYPVEYMSDYIKTTADDIDIFEYAALHFWDESKTAASDSGTVSIIYTVDLAKCKSTVEANGGTWNGTLAVQTTLWYENVMEYDGADSLFSTLTGDQSRSVTVTVNGAAQSITNTGDMITVDKTFTGLASSGTYSFTVAYTFNVPMNAPGTQTPSNFRTCFGKYLKAIEGDETKFHTTAKVVTLE